MTNGEMIQKDFNCEVCEPIPEDDIIHVIFSDKNDSAIGFDWSWWNAEYKEPTTKNDLGVASELEKNSKKLEKDFGELDCVSRDSAIKALGYDIKSFEFKPGVSKHMVDIVKLLNTIYETQVNNIKALPSVTPQEPKTGHWIPTYGNVKCSVCGSVKDSREVGKATHYCDFCGARMFEPQESEAEDGKN